MTCEDVKVGQKKKYFFRGRSTKLSHIGRMRECTYVIRVFQDVNFCSLFASITPLIIADQTVVFLSRLLRKSCSRIGPNE